MPLNLTDNLGPKVEMATGRWIPTTETFIRLTASQAQTRLFVAQVSDTYLVRWYLEVDSNATSGRVVPQVNFFTYGTGVGRQRFQRGLAMDATNQDATSSSWMMIRSANSDIFISADLGANGALPIVQLYCSLSRPS